MFPWRSPSGAAKDRNTHGFTPALSPKRWRSPSGAAEDRNDRCGLSEEIKRIGERIGSADLLPSFGTVGDVLDNAMMESFWSSIQI